MSINNNYDLIYTNSDYSISLVNKNVWQKDNWVNDNWESNNFFLLEGSNLNTISVEKRFSKITQIHTGEYIFINEKCNLCMCDSNFSNIKLISDNKNFYKGVTQLSNYLIALIGSNGSIYCIKSLKNIDIKQYFNDGKSYSSIKQTFDGKVIVVEGTSCGDTYTFDLIKNGLTNKKILPIDKSFKSRLTIATPNNQQIFNLNCDLRYKTRLYKYDFKYNLDFSLKKSPCLDGEDYEDDLLCYAKCRDGYKGIATVCWRDKRLTYDRGVGIIPDQDGSRCNGLTNVAYDLIGQTCTGWDSCQSRTPVVTTKLCKSCTYDNYTWGCNGDRCGYNDEVCAGGTCLSKSSWDGCCSKTKRTCTLGVCVGGDCIGCVKTDSCASRTQRTCSRTAKCCNDGIKTTLTGINCNKCGTYDSTTGGDCVGGISSARPAPISCKSNRQLEGGLCYIKPDDGYTCGATVCSLNDASYDRGVGTLPKDYSQIICTNCCSFDLTFINNNYNKPSTLKMEDLPVKNQLVAYYNADSFLNGIWYDLTSNLNNAVYLKGNIKKVNNYITGDVNTSILFPFDILPDEYTIFHVCKYNGNKKGKILTGYQSKWSSGFASGLSGVAIHDTWITQSELSVFDDKWVFSTDTNNLYRANMNNYTINNNDLAYQTPLSTNNNFSNQTQLSTNNNFSSQTQLSTNDNNIFTQQTQLSINLNDLPEENSDWAIACIIVFERKLTSTEIDNMERWLSIKYSDLWSQTYYQTFKQLGYSCFDNKIGKITNNYTKYEYASYNGSTIDCKWLNYPQKKQIDELLCRTSNSYPLVNVEEGFTNTFESINNLEFIIKLLILILILWMVIYNTRKN